MSAVREFMTTDAQCIKENQSLVDAARMMMDLDCGSLPICGDDGKLKGMITDRDIVLKCVAAGRDPREMMARDLASGKPHWIDKPECRSVQRNQEHLAGAGDAGLEDCPGEPAEASDDVVGGSRVGHLPPC